MRVRHLLVLIGVLVSVTLVLVRLVVGGGSGGSGGSGGGARPSRDPSASNDEAAAFVKRPSGGRSTFSATELVALCHVGNEWTIERGRVIAQPEPTSAPTSLEPQKREFLGSCKQLEIIVHQDGRSMGHCSDYVQYILHADARLNPEFDEATYAKKLKLCPQSTFLFFEVARRFFFSNTTSHRNIWIPNIEQIDKWQHFYFPRTHQFLCKTKVTCEALRKYLKANGLERPLKPSSIDLPYAHPHLSDQQLVYMSHTSVDIRENALTLFGPNHLKKLHQDFNKFIHVHGSSGRKHTRQVFDCWKWHPEWPELVIVGSRNKTDYMPDLGKKGAMRWPPNIKLYNRLSIKKLRALQVTHGVHICPSNQEGYGHYINEARSLSALVLTTNYAPMNEMVVDGESGILIDYDPLPGEAYQLMQDHFVSPVRVSSEYICSAIEKVLKMPLEERKRMGRKAREGYDYDKVVMEGNMEEFQRGVHEYYTSGWKQGIVE